MNIWYQDMNKDVQFHLFDKQTTEYDIKDQNDIYQKMAESVIHWLTKNGVKKEDYPVFVPRILARNLQVESKSYKTVLSRINKILGTNL